jgi:transposase
LQILEQRGFEVCLVNARHVKNVPGRKTDVSDCQWLQYLHSVGLLQASFQPAQQVCALRSPLRHRDCLVQMASAYARRMQKALDQMNLQLHHVISDITGVSGVTILEAILNGERDPLKLARLRDYRIRASGETVAKSLVPSFGRSQTNAPWQLERHSSLRMLYVLLSNCCLITRLLTTSHNRDRHIDT